EPFARDELRKVCGLQLLAAAIHQRRDRAMSQAGIHVERVARRIEELLDHRRQHVRQALPAVLLGERECAPARLDVLAIGFAETFRGGDAAVGKARAPLAVGGLVERSDDLGGKAARLLEYRAEQVRVDPGPAEEVIDDETRVVDRGCVAGHAGRLAPLSRRGESGFLRVALDKSSYASRCGTPAPRDAP